MLIGLEFTAVIKAVGNNVGDAVKYGLIISAAVIVIRLLSTLGASVFTMFISRFITTADSRPGWRGPIVFGWAGMRGVVSLASALSIPLVLKSGDPFPHRDLIIFITFIVILVTLVFQGLTLPWVIRKFGEPERDYLISEHEQEAMVKTEMKNVALNLLEQEYQEDVINNTLLKELKTRLANELAYVDGRHERSDEETLKNKTRFHDAFKHVIDVQRHKLQELNLKPEFEEEVIKKYVSQLDLEEEKLRQQFEL